MIASQNPHFSGDDVHEEITEAQRAIEQPMAVQNRPFSVLVSIFISVSMAERVCHLAWTWLCTASDSLAIHRVRGR